jgi:hypothetical protein
VAVKFHGKKVPFAVWVCEMCPSLDRAKRPDGLPSNFCVKCESKFLGAISAWRSKKDSLWFLRPKKEKVK